ncbi:MAG: hypothetical protein ACXVAE_02170 [Candidatus Limnocylindrales bacterium]
MTTPAAPGGRPPRPDRPLYRGAPLEAERGPGLGCFWFQAVLLAIVLVLIPIGVWNDWSIYLTGGLLILALVLVFFTSLTVIFLLRLVAADRRSRRRPLSPTARPTVGDLEAEDEDGMRQ